MKIYKKLVRDKIPEIIEEAGQKPVFHTLTESDYIIALEQKLDEEVAEFHESNSIEELADIYETLRYLREAYGYTLGDISRAIKKKYKERGGFDNRIYLDRVEGN